MATASQHSSPPDPDYAPSPTAGSHPEVFHDSRPGGSVSVLAGDQRLVLSVTGPQLHCGSHCCCPHSHPDHYSHPDQGHPLHSGPTGASPGLGPEITVDLSFEGRGRCSSNIHTAARSNSIAIDRLGTAGGFESFLLDFPDVVSNYIHPLQQVAPTLPSQQFHNYDSASSATCHQSERHHNQQQQQHWASAQHERTTIPTCGVTVGAAGQRLSDEAARWATEDGVERNRTRQSTTTSSSSSSSTSSIRSVLILLALLAILSSLVGVVLISRGHSSFVYAVAFMGLGLTLSTGVCVARKCVALTSQPPETAPARQMLQRFPSGTRQRQRRPRRWWTHGGERMHRTGRRNAYSSASPGPRHGGAGLLEFQHLASSPPPYDDVEGLHASQTRSAGDTAQPYASYSVCTALANGSGDWSYPTRDLAPDSPPPSYRSVASSSRAGLRVFFPDPVESGSTAPPHPPPPYWSPSASSVGSEPGVFNSFLSPGSQSSASNSPPPSYRSGAGSQRRRPRLYGVDESEADSHLPPSRLSVDDEAEDDDQPSAGSASAVSSPLPDPHRSGAGRRQRPRLHVYGTETSPGSPEASSAVESPATSPTSGPLYWGIFCKSPWQWPRLLLDSYTEASSATVLTAISHTFGQLYWGVFGKSPWQRPRLLVDYYTELSFATESPPTSLTLRCLLQVSQRSRLLVDNYAEAPFAGGQQPRLLLDNYTEVSSATVLTATLPTGWQLYWSVFCKRPSLLLDNLYWTFFCNSVTSDLAY